MSIETTVKLQPFSVPNFVLSEPKIGSRQNGIGETPKFSLSECSAETLDALCDRFRADVFDKAGKSDPKA